jgi:hypothetical protein
MARIQVAAARGIAFIGLRPSGLWWWHVELDGSPVAVAGRCYHRQRECRYNMDQFMRIWPIAVIPEPTQPTQPTPTAVRGTGGGVLPLRNGASETGPLRWAR